MLECKHSPLFKNWSVPISGSAGHRGCGTCDRALLCKKTRNPKFEIRNNTKIQNSNDQNGWFDLRIPWILNIRHSNSFQFSPWEGRKAEEMSKYKCQNNQNGVSLRLWFWILNIRYSDLFRISCFEFRIFLLRIMFEVPYPLCPAGDMGHGQFQKGGLGGILYCRTLLPIGTYLWHQLYVLPE